MTGSAFDEALIEAELRGIGARFDPAVLAEARELYRAPTAALPWAARPIVADLPYGLAPRNHDTWPSGNEDMAAILYWIEQNAADHGGDSRRMVIVGQSAGAAHVAGYLFDPRSRGNENTSIRAVALLSGFYRAKSPMVGGPLLYFGSDAANWTDRSPATYVRSGSCFSHRHRQKLQMRSENAEA